MTLETASIGLLKDCLEQLDQGMADLPVFDPAVDTERLADVLQAVTGRMLDNYPYAHPHYAGQMLKPPHPVARLAYMMALWVNPNNHALDGGRASSAMEKAAVADIARMFRWSEHLGHLTSGGTMANLEALWVAGRLHPGRRILASQQAHYTHSRITDVLGIPFGSVPVDPGGRMDVDALAGELAAGDVGTVVVTLGTTGIGSVDPLPEILELQARYQFRIHVDAAYGGYFVLADNLAPSCRAAFEAISEADSIVVDPHKHGLQPYGCGCVLFRDPSVGTIYQHDSPYTYFSSTELHLGEISLECSRAGAAAVALYATQQLLPMQRGGEFANGLMQGRDAALEWYRRLCDEPRELQILQPQLDIVVWAPAAEKASEISRLSQTVFEAAEKAGLYLAVMQLPATLLAQHWPAVEFDQQQVSCLRSCMMKPEHLAWLDSLWSVYQSVR